MRPSPAVHYDADAIKELLAEHHGVPVKSVIRNQYSYTVVLEDKSRDEGKSEKVN